jgi:hypothetical protein
LGLEPRNQMIAKSKSSRGAQAPTAIISEKQGVSAGVYLPQLVTTDQAHRFEFETRSLPGRRVVCGNSRVSWQEQAISADSPLFGYVRSSSILQLVSSRLSLEGLIDLSQTVCWVSRYRMGEYIGLHRDCAGIVQLLLCLKAPMTANGGVLVLRLKQGDRSFPLKDGDGLLFRAAEIEHYTTELVPTKRCPNPVRVVAAARYFTMSANAHLLP